MKSDRGWFTSSLAVAIALASWTALSAGDPRVAVPATDEITLLDPHVSADGKPTPIIVTGADGEPHVDIPPTIIVHNFYYTGDRDFRGPRLVGGPSIVVVSHPATGERLYLDVQMLPGSPRIIYRKDQIDYEFGHDRIRIHFGYCRLTKCHKAEVSYVDGKDKVLRGENASKSKPPSPIANAFANTTIALSKVSQVIVGPALTVVQSTPVGAVFADPTETLATAQRDLEVQKAAVTKDQAELTIPTNR